MPFGMGIEGGEGLEAFGAALEDATGDLSRFDRAVAGGTKTMGEASRKALSQTVGFAGNTAARQAQTFARGTVFSALSRSVELRGGESFSQSVTMGALSAASAIPIIGSIFGDVVSPLQAAGSRTAGITTAIARAGGTVTPELRESLFGRFRDQEKRAQAEKKAIGALAGSKENVGLGMIDSKLGELIDLCKPAASAITSISSTLKKWWNG